MVHVLCNCTINRETCSKRAIKFTFIKNSCQEVSSSERHLFLNFMSYVCSCIQNDFSTFFYSFDKIMDFLPLWLILGDFYHVLKLLFCSTVKMEWNLLELSWILNQKLTFYCEVSILTAVFTFLTSIALTNICEITDWKIWISVNWIPETYKRSSFYLFLWMKQNKIICLNVKQNFLQRRIVTDSSSSQMSF